MPKSTALNYLEWLALASLYKYRGNLSSPVRYVGLAATVASLINRHPPLAQWVGKPSQNQVRITDDGILLYEGAELIGP